MRDSGAGEILIPSTPRRDGWEKSFCLMAERGDDRLLDDAEPTVFDEEEWDW
jgi:hypothetical protein